nr:DUF397 domain-containing protein [Streptomyces caatingaensis]
MPERQWQKSSFSNPVGDGDCIEVSVSRRSLSLRESGHPQTVLTLTPSTLRSLLDFARRSPRPPQLHSGNDSCRGA